MFNLAEPVAFRIKGEGGGSVLCHQRAEAEPTIEQLAKQYPELCQDPALELDLEPLHTADVFDEARSRVSLYGVPQSESDNRKTIAEERMIPSAQAIKKYDPTPKTLVRRQNEPALVPYRLRLYLLHRPISNHHVFDSADYWISSRWFDCGAIRAVRRDHARSSRQSSQMKFVKEANSSLLFCNVVYTQSAPSHRIQLILVWGPLLGSRCLWYLRLGIAPAATQTTSRMASV